MKTIIKKLLAHYWLVYPVLILKMFIYYWQTKRLDMLSIYDVPLLSLLFLFCNLIVGDNTYSRLNFDCIFPIKSKKIYKGNLSQSRRLPPSGGE